MTYYNRKWAATLVTVLAGLGLIGAIICFIIEINGFTGFRFLFYFPAVLFMAVVLTITGTAIVHEIKVAINAHRAKKINKDIIEQ